MDDPEMILNGALENHYKMINEFKVGGQLCSALMRDITSCGGTENRCKMDGKSATCKYVYSQSIVCSGTEINVI
jgi:hypothetical protein